MQSDRYARLFKALAGVALALCSSLLLVGCGGSSSSSDSSASSKSVTSASSKPRATGSTKSTALRSCLQKQGITLPSAPTGAKPGSPASAPSTGSSGQRPGGGFKLPKGESAAQLQAALKKCGGGSFPAGGTARFGGKGSSKVLAKFSTCMRENGVNLPAPNTSGKGPVFNTKGLNTTSASFKSAESKCRSDLGAAGGAPNKGGSPPGEGEAPTGGAPPAGEGG